MTSTDSELIAGWLRQAYSFLGAPKVSLLRAYTNDVFLVEAAEQKYVLKVYATDWRSDDEIRYELDLVEHLVAHGINVATSLMADDGHRLQVLNHQGIKRQAVLFGYADGFKPQPPFSLDDYYAEGVAAAKLHGAADSFRTTLKRRALDLDFMVEQPRRQLLAQIDDNEFEQTLNNFCTQIDLEVRRFVDLGLDWGPCHGDLTFDNFHRTKDGAFVWYDFDSGGPGWRAIDIQGWSALQPDRRVRQETFVNGYRTVRPLSDNDVAASPYVYVAQEVWGWAIELQFRVDVTNPQALQEFRGTILANMAHWRQVLAEIGSHEFAPKPDDAK